MFEARLIEMHLGSRLAAAREEMGLDRSALAALAGVSDAKIAQYENGLGNLSASMLWRLARCLNAAPDTFYDGAGRRV